ncbi:alpha-L-fucosidase [Niastella koreensis]|uniref:Alpha-L-fucosidase n=2 Tax=Niastella koreensis TaxID=354356 RepID=G8TNJ9_NIAKG|nr:glycoside hydrolase N-terminal domain-containing protein [Niastella koreensis]AEV99916.1 Alpha-L-fucosidase [Niastella koreensis GR20-10]OQP51475.1 alpha-L-fucosidase [Niastella koreensis]
MHLKTWLRFSLLLTVVSPFSQSYAQKQPLRLWYQQPAATWTDALPLGNGRLGAMVFGGVGEEHLQLNEETLWSGRPRSYSHPGAAQYLQPMRQLLAEGKQAESEAMGEKYFMGLKAPDDSAYELQKDTWFRSVRAQIEPAGVTYNDNNWPAMQLPTPEGWERVGLEGTDGSLWFRTSFNVPAKWLGKNLVLDLGRIRDLDYTYVNGQLVGHDEGISKKRKYTIPASALKEGKNTVAIQVINFFDKGGFTGVKGTARTLVVYPEGGDVDTVSLGNTWKYFIQNDAPPALPRYEADYLPFGDLYFRFAHGNNSSDYQRSLDLDNAISTVSYTANGVSYNREYFISAPHQCVVMHVTASKPGALSLQAVLNTPHKKYVVKKIDDHTLSLSLEVSNGVLKAVGYLYATATGGRLTVNDTAINLQQATEVNFYLVAATSFKNYKDVSGDPVAACKAALARVKGVPYASIKTAHLNEYHKLFETFSFTVPAGKNSGLPTNERIRQFNMKDDAALVPLFLMYSRYLLISSSRPGTQPANLQGIWNDLLTPPWGSKYTTNINLEMNYWTAEVLNLSTCTQPLFNMINELAVAGHQTAKDHYNAPGWVLHHNTDLWRGTAPINASNHGIWVTGAAWLTLHIWEHFLYTQDTAFLRAQYPNLQGAAQFFEHFLVKDPKTGYLISTPSNSPEHGGLVAGPTMDHQIIRELFRNCSAAAAVLKTDAAFAERLKTLIPQIAPNKIGKHNQLQEWMEDIDDVNDQHRHISHLWGVFPGTDITWKDSAMMKAARQSLIYRGDGGTGWSLSWKVNVWARFKEGDHALLMVRNLFTPAMDDNGRERGGLYNNLFDAHPPFQIDGNFGASSGIAEMIMQSHTGVIELLPALPGELPDGEVKCMCARGGFVLDISWKQGRLNHLKVVSKNGNTCHLKYGAKEIELATKKNGSYIFNGSLNRQ